MVSIETKGKILKILFVIGLLIAVASSLENSVSWIGSFCSWWGDGCRETSVVTLFNVSIPVWGIIYYLVLILCAFFAKEALFYIVMAGAGFELTLLAMMIEMKWVCIFCLFNLFVVCFTVVLLYENKRIWQALALAVIFFMASDHLLSQGSAGVGSSKPKDTDTQMVATIAGKQIQAQELNESISANIYKLENQIYELKKRQLNDLIDKRLLTLDAKEKGIDPNVYIQTVYTNSADVSDKEVYDYIKKNPGIMDSWKGREEELKSRIKTYLKDLKIKQRVKSITDPLRKKHSVKTYLDQPALPTTSIEQGSSPFLGPANAKVVVYEFSDYQCPSCRNAHKISLNVRNKFKDKVKWVFKDYPLTSHTHAWVMAEAARCANDQGKFWEYQDHLYTFKGDPDMETYKGFAETLGLDMGKFSACMESKKYKALVAQEKMEGKQAGVSSTPTFVINGKLRPGYMSEEKMIQWINRELKKSAM